MRPNEEKAWAENEYSQQEVRMLKAVQKRALEVKKEKKCIK